MKPTPEQLKNGFLISVATVFAIAGAGMIQNDPILGTIYLLVGVLVFFLREILKKL